MQWRAPVGGVLEHGQVAGGLGHFLDGLHTGGIPMEPFLVSTMVVEFAEIGDKTQILSLMLAARFQRPVPIIFGILFATIADHAAAGFAGTLFGSLLAGPWMRRR
jgi:hypothetical protein